MATHSDIFPATGLFTANYEKKHSQFVWTKRVADLETPVSAALKLKEKGKPFFLLESVEGGEVRGRYSILGLEPDLVWECRGDEVYFNSSPNRGEVGRGALDTLSVPSPHANPPPLGEGTEEPRHDT